MSYKLKDILHVGMEMYYVKESYYPNPPKLVVGKVTSIELYDDSSVRITLKANGIKYTIYEREYKKTLFFSFKKADNVQESLKKSMEAMVLRAEKRSEAYDYNEKRIESFIESTRGFNVGDSVLIKVEDNVWEKSSIKRVGSTYKKDTYYFVDSLRKNNYLSSREGKNWKRWSKLDELRSKKEALEREIKELEEES